MHMHVQFLSCMMMHLLCLRGPEIAYSVKECCGTELNMHQTEQD